MALCAHTEPTRAFITGESCTHAHTHAHTVFCSLSVPCNLRSCIHTQTRTQQQLSTPGHVVIMCVYVYVCVPVCVVVRWVNTSTQQYHGRCTPQSQTCTQSPTNSTLSRRWRKRSQHTHTRTQHKPHTSIQRRQRRAHSGGQSRAGDAGGRVARGERRARRAWRGGLVVDAARAGVCGRCVGPRR